MGRGSKSTELLKESMADALIALLPTKAPEKITVTEITDLAGVGRASWFRNFEGKEDALAFKLRRLWYRYSEHHGIALESRLYTPSLAAEFFRFCYETRDLYTLIYKCNMQSAVYEAFYQIVMSGSKETVDDCYRSRFISYGLFGMLNEWIGRDCAQSAEELTRQFLSIYDI